jgi:hypothetical protein
MLGRESPRGTHPTLGEAVYVILGIIHPSRDDIREGNPCLPYQFATNQFEYSYRADITI